MALARAVAPARHAAAAFLVVFAALLAVSTTAQAQTTGICGRTAAVRTAILGKISVRNCANVTDAHLAAITGNLLLHAKGITALAAGDFDGLTALTGLALYANDFTELPAGVFDELTALTTLLLFNNSLDTLPAGVFDELTELEILSLWGNSLTTLPDDVFEELTALEQLTLAQNSLASLPAGVFDELTSLTSLTLSSNSLDTLPDDVFDKLTAVTQLTLYSNPGAPFSPTADALPDDGTVLDAGGDVTLDGSGSGGAWGTNVTYSWRQTSGPTTGVTFDDAASATPVVTIPALTVGTELTFTLTVTARGIDGGGVNPDTDTATVTVTAVFDPTAGICGRTEAVRTAILGKISGVSNCANVTDAHLAAISTGLNLNGKGITALAAGDFDGLTALTELDLRGNDLASLPAGVFDELTALTELDLRSNDLSTLPAGVFEELTALTYLNLYNNPGAPFSPTANALPDDGTVLDAGGDVTLDGSGSDGGPWGTNVTYSWALTSPTSGVTVTFDDAASATPVVTIPALANGTELTFTLTATGRGAGYAFSGILRDTDTAHGDGGVRPHRRHLRAHGCGARRDRCSNLRVTHCADVSPTPISPPSPATCFWSPRASPPSRRGISTG